MAAIFESSVDELLARTEARTPEVGAGPHVALAAASAAAVATMCARFAGWDEARVGELVAARERLRELADADGPAFAPLVQAWQLPKDDPEREERITQAARTACAVPLEVCRVGTAVARVAAELHGSVKPDLVGDAATALRLADAAVASAADVVRLDAAPDRAPDLVEAARALAQRTHAYAEALRDL